MYPTGKGGFGTCRIGVQVRSPKPETLERVVLNYADGDLSVPSSASLMATGWVGEEGRVGRGRADGTLMWLCLLRSHLLSKEQVVW